MEDIIGQYMSLRRHDLEKDLCIGYLYPPPRLSWFHYDPLKALKARGIEISKLRKTEATERIYFYLDDNECYGIDTICLGRNDGNLKFAVFREHDSETLEEDVTKTTTDCSPIKTERHVDDSLHTYQTLRISYYNGRIHVLSLLDSEGLYHCDNMPAKIMFKESSHPNIVGIDQQWFRHGEEHRDNAPAALFVDIVGNRVSSTTLHWIKNGSFHRKDGPAQILIDRNRKWCSKHFYLDGEEFSEEEFWKKVKKPYQPPRQSVKEG